MWILNISFCNCCVLKLQTLGMCKYFTVVYYYTHCYINYMFSLFPHWLEIFTGFCFKASMLMKHINSNVENLPLPGIWTGTSWMSQHILAPTVNSCFHILVITTWLIIFNKVWERSQYKVSNVSCQYELSHHETAEGFHSAILVLICIPAKAPFQRTWAVCEGMNNVCSACVLKEFAGGTYMHHVTTN
jgi:hypothetical protein